MNSHKVHERCKGCKYSSVVTATGGFRFLGCRCSPYCGKWVIEIEHCPKIEEGAVKDDDYNYNSAHADIL